MYSERRSRWLRLGAAVANFHAGSIGDPALARTEEKAARTRDRVEKRLAQLTDDHPGLPMVIFLYGPSTRTIWPGLQDRHFNKGPMPGDTLRDAGREVAVVRSNDGPEIGRPVTRQDEGNQPRDPLPPAAPGRRVYRRTDTPEPVWLFPGISKTYGAMRGATSARYTRWTCPAHLAASSASPGTPTPPPRSPYPAPGHGSLPPSPPSPHGCASSPSPGTAESCTQHRSTSPSPPTKTTPTTGQARSSVSMPTKLALLATRKASKIPGQVSPTRRRRRTGTRRRITPELRTDGSFRHLHAAARGRRRRHRLAGRPSCINLALPRPSRGWLPVVLPGVSRRI